MQVKWNIADRKHDDLVTQLLVNRGISASNREVFLHPDWDRDTHSPFIFTRMQEAVDAMFIALEKGDPIVIHGDYDADGVSGSSLLFGALQDIVEKMNSGVRSSKMNLDLTVFLPDREKDGYGVAMHTIERFITEGKKLIVTVDCGIASGLELGRAHEAGIVTIVCDHHQMGTHFPSNAFVIHPLAPGETYPNKTLCGTGVAFKFASALIEEARKRGADFPIGYEKWFLDLVAVATVTDVMPLTGENRVLETFGLKVLQKTRRPGLRAILSAAGVDPLTVDTQAIGFRIGPRLNAAGRLASASLAFDTLTASSIEQAQILANQLEGLNKQRQSIFKESYKVAEAIVKSSMMDHAVLVVDSNEWLPGIVGLIAGRLVNDFNKPAFALTKIEGKFVGSGRTAGGLHLVNAMNACGDEIFLRKGGHPQACGLSIVDNINIDLFRARVNEFAVNFFGANGPNITRAIDAVVDPSRLTIDSIVELDACAPFGEGNRPPIFATLKAVVMSAETMGATNTHLRLTIKDSAGKVAKMVGFGMGEKAPMLPMGTIVDIAYAPGINSWNGRREVQCLIEDIRNPAL